MKQDRFSGTYSLTPNGYVWRWKLIFQHPVPLQTFRNDPVDPLTFHTSSGDTIQPFRTFDGYDRASVPLLLQGVVSSGFAEMTTINHDSAFHFKAWWRNGTMETITMAKANSMLYRMARAEFRQARPQVQTWIGKAIWALNDLNNRATCGAAWLGVAVGGRSTWNATDPLTADNRRRIANVDAAIASGKTDPGEVVGAPAKPPADAPA